MSQLTGEAARLRSLIAAEKSDSVEGAVGWLRRLCRAAARELPASGVAISVMTEEGSSSLAGASDTTTEAIEELQFTLGEGPCLDAFATRRPVLVPDLTRDAARRWPGYSAAVPGYGIRAVFAFPLQIGAARLGALDVYREQAGPLSAAALSQALTFAKVATMTLLEGQENANDGKGPAGLDEALDSHFAVHQAQGMVTVQLGVNLIEAMARLRAYAYAQDRGLGEVARDIVARKLNLEKDER